MSKLRAMQQIPQLERPREKMQRKGAAHLSDFELLEVMIGSGNNQVSVGQIARQIQRTLRSGVESLNIEKLMELQGVNVAQASKILASLELARRHLVRDALPLHTLQDYLGRLAELRGRQQEYFICLSLDGGQRLIAQRTVTIGTLDTVLAHPREVFADPLVDRAASVVIAHNHPSGDCEPSDKDIVLTQQLVAAGQLLGVPLRDHIILTKTGAFSFRQQHLL
ncbi:MAG TPA: DNA repair protein RadC [Candidatus Saccharimonadales bacterium]